MRRMTLLAAATGIVLGGCSAPETVQSPVQPVTQSGSGKTTLNAIRADANLPPLSENPALTAAAHGHARDMDANGFFSHTGSGGSTVGKRVRKAGYRFCTVAENIAKGFRTRAAALESWRTSPGHYRNMTKGKIKEYGIAQVGDIWVLVLAAKRC